MKKYKSIYKEGSFAGDYGSKKYEILGISLDGSKNIYLVGFKKEKNAEDAKDYFENTSDITIFNVDPYGHSTFEEAEKYFSKNNKVVGYSISNTDKAIQQNPDALVKQVYNSIKKG